MGELQGRTSCTDSGTGESTDDSTRECEEIDFDDPNVQYLVKLADAMALEGEARVRYIRSGKRYLETVL